MPSSIILTHNRSKYVWAPSRSTPSAKQNIAELPVIIDQLTAFKVKSVVDFGAGRGRNSLLLARTYREVTLVEDSTNIPILNHLVETSGATNITVQTWQQYRNEANPKLFDAIFICFVVHTLPGTNMRSAIIRTNLAHLKSRGLLVFITPNHDSKYTENNLSHAVHFRDGIVRLHAGQKSFSFYRNYTQDEFTALIDGSGLQITSSVPSHSRMIFVCQRKY
jgi:2-polyprenyl-3-methyl-5-hydroxy-6-metoxy-1,4-benzoquinol methylase